MVDFRKYLSPKSRAEMAERQDAMMRFQELSPAEMARTLLESARLLQDSPVFETDQRWSYDEWALYRVIPELARALDPEVELLKVENPDDAEAEDKVTWVRGAPPEKLKSAISSILSHGSLRRAHAPEVDGYVTMIADRLISGSGGIASYLSIAADTVFPGISPERVTPEDRPDLPGVQVILSTTRGYNRVIKYTEDRALADRYFDVAVAQRTGGEIADEDHEISESVQLKNIRAEVLSITIETFKGKILRQHILTPAPEPDPYDRADLAEAYGFRVDPASVFNSDAPAELRARAEDAAIGHGGYSWAIWDPQDDDDGYLIVGDNEARLRREFEDHARGAFDPPRQDDTEDAPEDAPEPG